MLSRPNPKASVYILFLLIPLSAVAAIVRSYVSEATSEKERTGAMAGVSSSQALGFILGPGEGGHYEKYSSTCCGITLLYFYSSALGLAFVPLGSKGFFIEPIKFHFNMYTGPGYLSALMGVINIVLLIFFKEVKLGRSKDKKKPSVSKMTDRSKFLGVT